MAEKKKRRCYIYTRVSSQSQVDGYSLDAQRDRLLKAAEYEGMTIAAEFSDEGKSGKNTTGRPEFTEMMDRIQNGNPDKVDYVLVFKLSRFGRNTADVMNSLQIMVDNGVDLLAVEDKIDSSGPAGKLMIAVLAAVAENIQGKRNEYRVVEQEQYPQFDGRHEAIISDELWEAVRAKRQQTAGKPQQHYGPKNVYMLSGIVKCPA